MGAGFLAPLKNMRIIDKQHITCLLYTSAAASKCGVRAEDCTVFDDSLAACQGARKARMRVVGVYDGFFAQDEKEMRGFCDVYIKSFEELLYLPEQRERRKK